MCSHIPDRGEQMVSLSSDKNSLWGELNIQKASDGTFVQNVLDDSIPNESSDKRGTGYQC